MPDKVILLMNFEREGKATCWFKFLFSFQGLASLLSVKWFYRKAVVGRKRKGFDRLSCPLDISTASVNVFPFSKECHSCR